MSTSTGVDAFDGEEFVVDGVTDGEEVGAGVTGDDVVDVEVGDAGTRREDAPPGDIGTGGGDT